MVYGGHLHFGYVPDGPIAGISKIPRLVHPWPPGWWSRRNSSRTSRTIALQAMFRESVVPGHVPSGDHVKRRPGALSAGSCGATRRTACSRAGKRERPGVVGGLAMWKTTVHSHGVDVDG
jgi:hypothetical protein